jgi:3-oxoacyl-(acyl-carrier-protein) synthase
MLRAVPVAITGLGLVSAAGNTLAATLGAIDSGVLPDPVAPPFPTTFPSPVFSVSASLTGEDGLSRTARLAFCAVREALADAGMEESALPSLRVGVAVGTSVGASLDFFAFYRADEERETPPLTDIRTYLASNPAQALAWKFSCTGPVQSVTNACSSGADAIGIGCAWLRLGICDIVLAGGADALSYVTYAGFSSLRLPSPDVCRPFDLSRNGLTLGEGAGFVVLESEASRIRRGVSAKGYVVGYGTATDAFHLTASHPEGMGLFAAVTQAFTQAGASWMDIAFINAHGTATAANDAMEGAFFKQRCPKIPVIATKGATGHTLGAAGAVEAILALCHLNDGVLPASPRFREADPSIGFAPVATHTAVNGRFAMSQSLAFGGNNSVLLLAGETA